MMIDPGNTPTYAFNGNRYQVSTPLLKSINGKEFDGCDV